MDLVEDLEKKHKNMIAHQIAARGIKDPLVLEAMSKVPRHEFVSPKDISFAYDDHPLPIGHGQTISQPYMVALMTECLKLKGTESVLEIGTGSGYQTAILSLLAEKVYTVERIPQLAQRAREKLKELEYNNVEVIHGDGTFGFPEHSPFDGIIVTAAAPEVPPALLKQLTQEGRLVIPVGKYGYQDLLRISKIGDRYDKEFITACVFVPLLPGVE
jgi:protein-L-isoaspartate(D-aspartate) O-methyltransferase